MSLFKLSDIKKKEAKTFGPTAMHLSAKSKHLIGTSLKTLRSTIGDLKENEVISFATAGKWSMHDLLMYVLDTTGPSVVYMTTWTIAEESMRIVLELIEQGLITELHAVLDYRIEKRKPEAFQLAKNLISRIKLTKCHAKTLVIRNEKLSVTIIGSSNFSKNPRIEAGVIFTDTATADFHQSWINDVIGETDIFYGTK
jgi:hypothetical protein